MDFIKKNYEKILLGAVLLGLVGALVYLPIVIKADKEKQEEMTKTILHPKITQLTNLDMTIESNVFERLQSPYQLDFESSNKLFNPFEWQKTANNTLVPKSTGTGPRNAIISNITPLYLTLTLDSVMTNELGARYVIYVERQAAALPAQRRKMQRYVSLDDRKKDIFTLLDVKGQAENPEHLVLQLADTAETVTLSREKPYRRVDGYMADIRYEPEGKNWNQQRVGSRLRFAGDDYTIVDIKTNEVILSAQSNQKRWTLPFTKP